MSAPSPEAPALSPPPSQGRLLSLDVFRGFTLAMMLIANNAGDWKHVLPPFKHADWNGCTFTDLIFPGFVFIMGVAMTFSFARRLAEGADKGKLFLQVVKRTLILIALGLFLAGFGYALRHLTDPEAAADSIKKLRYPGVLQRLGLCYFFAALVLLSGLRARGQAIVAAVLLLGYHIIMKYVPVPGYGAGVLELPGNLATYIDDKVFGPHAHKYIKAADMWHDPEGLLSTLPAIASCLLGTITGYTIRDKALGDYEKVSRLMVWGFALVVLGWIWNYSFPMNKNLWTSSFVFFAGGWALLGLGACYWLTDIKRVKWWTTPFIVLGTNAIFTYVTVGIFSILSINIKFSDGDGGKITLKGWIYKNLVQSWMEPLFGPGWSSLGYGVFYIALWTLLVWLLLYRRRIFIRV